MSKLPFKLHFKNLTLPKYKDDKVEQSFLRGVYVCVTENNFESKPTYEVPFNLGLIFVHFPLGYVCMYMGM